jgi:putative PIN family toxin of toxin-antitoxin system
LDVVLSRYILDELVRVLPRLPRISLTAEEIRDLADSFVFLADMVEPASGQDENLRDPADQPILDALSISRAAYLVTGDKDLLALADSYSVISPAEFWARHGG